MRTFYFPIEKLFKKGLRPRVDVPANGEFLSAVTNMKPGLRGLETVLLGARTFNLNADAQVFTCYKGVYVLTTTQLYEYVDGALVELVNGILSGGLWSCADFRSFIVFTNGAQTVYFNGTTFVKDSGTYLPIALSVCNFRGRLILGGPSGSAFNGKDNWVAWTEPGNIKLLAATDTTSFRRNTAGYIPMPWEGIVYKVLPLNDKCIVYGNNGITALYLAPLPTGGGTLGLKHLSDIGLKGQGSVCSNGKEDASSEHTFVDSNGWLCRLTNELKVTKLGFKEFLV